MAKILIVYYSRTGFTRKVANALATALNADIEEIREGKSRNGFFGYIAAALDTIFGRETEIIDTLHDPADYDVVIIGSPVWAASPVPAIQAYIKKYATSLPITAWLCTLGGSGAEKAFTKLDRLVGHPSCARIALTDEHIKSGGFQVPLEEFVERVKNSIPVTNA